VDTQEPIEAALHLGELQVAVDLHCNRQGERVHVQETDPVLDAVLNQYPLALAGDELGGGSVQLVGLTGMLVGYVRGHFGVKLPPDKSSAWVCCFGQFPWLDRGRSLGA